MKSQDNYYVPEGSYWPIVGSIALTLLLGGFADTMHHGHAGPAMMAIGFFMLLFMVFGWLGQVVHESETGIYNKQVDKSFRWGMGWFIFSEVMFFAAFFGALFYARMLSVPWLGGADNNGFSYLLWPDFSATWPLLHAPDVGKYPTPSAVIPAWGVPALNTFLLLSSGVTITLAHWALVKNNRKPLILWMIATIALGAAFLYFQVHEYGEAYNELGLKLTSGIYGSTFFMLTGFHGMHVTLGTIMLTVILMRCIRGHFDSERHFAFEAVAWYWHFVDIVWLGLFIFVYWI